MDRSALWDYFTYKYVPSPKTIYSDIRQLPPAHAMVYDGSGSRVWRYWSPEPTSAERDADRAQERLEALLREVVPAHMLADVPVGVFLSGGLDSTTLVASLDKPRTFSIGFDQTSVSEAPYARRVAEHFGTQHQNTSSRDSRPKRRSSGSRRSMTSRLRDMAGWSNYAVAREARREVTVALSGEGGDELFSGYLHHIKFMKSRPNPVAAMLADRLPPFSKAGLSAYRRAHGEIERYMARTGPFTAPQKRELFADGFVAADYDDLWHMRRYWRPELDPIKPCSGSS